MKTILYTSNLLSSKVFDIELFKPFLKDQGSVYRFILVSTYLLENNQNSDMISQIDALKRKSLADLNSKKKVLTDLFNDHFVEIQTISSLGTNDSIVPRILYKYPVDYIISIQSQHNKIQTFIKSIKNDLESTKLTYQLMFK